MKDAPYNPEDIDFLASRGLDGDLSQDEQRQLDRALDSSDSLRADAAAMRKVNELIRRWAATPVEIDWDTHAKLIHARCQSDDESHNQPELDGILKHWARNSAAFDDDRFTAAVMRRVTKSPSTARTHSGRPWIFRLAVPLAAAAVLAMAFIGGSWINRDAGSQDFVSGRRTESPEEPVSPLDTIKAPTCIVRFARESLIEAPELIQPEVRRSSGISFTAFGLATVGVTSASGAP